MQSDLDYFQLLAEARKMGSQDSSGSCSTTLRLAVLADCATQHLQPLFRVLFQRKGINVELYEGAFAAIELEARNPTSALYKFQPQIVVVLHSVQAVRDRFYQSGDKSSFCDEVLQEFTSTWDSITSTSNALILQSTFVTPMERFFGNFDGKVSTSFSSVVSQFNSFIVEQARQRSNILLLDLDWIASSMGRQLWFDDRLWSLGKSLCSLEQLPLVAQNIVDVAAAAQGRGIKCIIVDLDNTLWAGVVGDDGPHGIRIGSHGEGECFFRLQCFLREMKRRGVLLAVCSKNERAAALRPFRENPEMVLKVDDFVAFVANWKNKPENIAAIREELNIGFDSILFLDDSPFERASVRTMLPEVIVPELPEDPDEWVKSLSEANLFEVASFSEQDARRGDSYFQEARRKAASESAPNFESFLGTLGMTIEVDRFSPSRLNRIAQLLQRSNQFNLTTRRHNEGECAAMMKDEGWIPLYAALSDRFGDHGLISVIILRPDMITGVLTITDWLMSCRVLGRGVEEYLMNYAVHQARSLNLHAIRASYVPTAKNEMVKDFYARFGFEKAQEAVDGASEWILNPSAYENRRVSIRAAAEKIGANTI